MKGDKNNKTSKSKVFREMMPYMNLGLQMVIPIILGAFIGKWIDEKNDTSPLWMIALSIFGIIVGMYSFFKTINDENKKKKSKKKK